LQEGSDDDLDDIGMEGGCEPIDIEALGDVNVDPVDTPATIANIVAVTPPIVRTRLTDAHATRSTTATTARLATCSKVLEAAKVKNVLDERERAAAGPTLHIEYDNERRPIRARVDWADIPPPRTALGSLANTIVYPGDDLPFVRTSPDARPSLDTTIRLAALCTEQTYAFRLIMVPLLLHMAGRSYGEVEQLTLSIFGHAGTGKSQIIKAVLWHLFQHEASHLVMVTSYSWKAAQLIATPANPGYSSHTMFGIARDSSRPIGSTKASADTFHSGVVMIINDEISFTPSCHLQVRYGRVSKLHRITS
jgi:hypothetical protein